MGGRGADQLAGARNHLGFEAAVGVLGMVAVERHGAGAVGVHAPEILVENRVAVDVVPARVADASIGQQRGEPLVRLVEGEGSDLAGLAEQPVQGVDVPSLAELGPEAARMPLTPGGAEHEVAAGEIGRHEVLVGAGGELLYPSASKVQFEQVIEGVARLARGVGEGDAVGVPREDRREDAAAPAIGIEQRRCRERAAGLLEHEQAAARAGAPSEVLHH